MFLRKNFGCLHGDVVLMQRVNAWSLVLVEMLDSRITFSGGDCMESCASGDVGVLSNVWRR